MSDLKKRISKRTPNSITTMDNAIYKTKHAFRIVLDNKETEEPGDYDIVLLPAGTELRLLACEPLYSGKSPFRYKECDIYIKNWRMQHVSGQVGPQMGDKYETI